jgi:hypothetical protein
VEEEKTAKVRERSAKEVVTRQLNLLQEKFSPLFDDTSGDIMFETNELPLLAHSCIGILFIVLMLFLSAFLFINNT